MAETYQVDPFWVIAVMWTESHFDVYARSHVNAMGLMQVLPETGRFLSRLLKRPVTKEYVVQMIHHPRFNIELGSIFLEGCGINLEAPDLLLLVIIWGHV